MFFPKKLWSYQFTAYIMFLFLNVTCTSAHEFKKCYIKDPTKHIHNQFLLKTIIGHELSLCDSTKTAADKANFLAANICGIAKAFANEFLADAYVMPDLDKHSMVAFNCFALWEGQNNDTPIPLTIFIYIWPSEELALNYQDRNQNKYYASSIHSHPITCAFAVLRGEITQKKYILSASQRVKLEKEDLFHTGEGEYDDLKNHSIHQLYAKHGTVPTLSLHAYGLGSAEEVFKCFKETRSAHTYYE